MDARLLWLALGSFAGGVEGSLIGSLLPAIGDTMGVSTGNAGQVVVAYSVAYGLGTPILATLFAGINRRRLLAAAEFTFGCGAVLVALSPQFELLLMSRVLLALGAGLYTASALATAVMIAPPERRGRALGVVVLGQSLASLIGVPVAAWIAATFGWRTVYFFIAAVAFTASAALFINLPKGLASDRQTLQERLSILKTPGIPVALLVSLLFITASFIPVIYVAPLAHAAGLGRDMLPYVLFASGLGALIGGNLGGRLSDWLGARNAIMLMAGLQVLVLIAFIGTAQLNSGLAPAAFFATMVFAGFAGWGFGPAQSSRLAELAPLSASLAISLNLTAMNLGVALTAQLGGGVLDAYGAAATAIAAIPFALLALALAAYAARRRTPG